MKDRLSVILWLLVGPLAFGSSQAQLQVGFYSLTCPNAEIIVRNAVIFAMQASPIVGPSVLRLFAHDCFIDGCDASIMLVDPAGANERSAGDNRSLQQVSLDTVNAAKSALEQACPGVVSCADVIAMAAEVAVNQMGGPSWSVLLGRKDGFISLATSVAGNLPNAHMNLPALQQLFGKMGLGLQDIVALSGAHSVGFSHCLEFADRLYSFNGILGAADPSLSAGYAATLQTICPSTGFNPTTVQPLDPVTAAKFDNIYYQQLLVGQGLLFSDQVLFVDNATTDLVTTYANNEGQFFSDFVNSMIALGNVGILTGISGEIRRNCSVVNGGFVSNPPPAAPVVFPPQAPITPPSTPAPINPPPISTIPPTTPPSIPAPINPPPTNPILPTTPPSFPVPTNPAPINPIPPTTPPAPVVIPAPINPAPPGGSS